MKYKIKIANGFNLDTLAFPEKLFAVQTGRGKMDRNTVQKMISMYTSNIRNLIMEVSL